MDYNEVHSHQSVHNKIVKSALRQIAAEKGVSCSIIQKYFRYGSEEITIRFWSIVDKEYPDTYCGVEFCSGCSKFSLTEVPKRALPRTRKAA